MVWLYPTAPKTMVGSLVLMGFMKPNYETSSWEQDV